MGYRIGNEWRPDLDIGVDAISEGFEAMDLDAPVAGRPIHQKIANDADTTRCSTRSPMASGGRVVGMIVSAYKGEMRSSATACAHMSPQIWQRQFDQFHPLADAAHDPRVLECCAASSTSKACRW